MRQRDVWLADLDPVAGSEQAGRRPVVVVSNDSLNESLSIVIVMPLTTKLKGYPACVSIKPTAGNGLTETSEAVTFQIRAVSKKRLKKPLGVVTEQQLKELLAGLLLVLTP